MKEQMKQKYESMMTALSNEENHHKFKNFMMRIGLPTLCGIAAATVVGGAAGIAFTGKMAVPVIKGLTATKAAIAGGAGLAVAGGIKAILDPSAEEKFHIMEQKFQDLADDLSTKFVKDYNDMLRSKMNATITPSYTPAS